MKWGLINSQGQDLVHGRINSTNIKEPKTAWRNSHSPCARVTKRG
jgi:hypothetical protein